MHMQINLFQPCSFCPWQLTCRQWGQLRPRTGLGRLLILWQNEEGRLRISLLSGELACTPQPDAQTLKVEKIKLFSSHKHPNPTNWYRPSIQGKLGWHPAGHQDTEQWPWWWQWSIPAKDCHGDSGTLSLWDWGDHQTLCMLCSCQGSKPGPIWRKFWYVLTNITKEKLTQNVLKDNSPDSYLTKLIEQLHQHRTRSRQMFLKMQGHN